MLSFDYQNILNNILQVSLIRMNKQSNLKGEKV